MAQRVLMMAKSACADPTMSLSYLPAAKVTSPAGTLAELEVLTCNGKPFGAILGVVVDAAARKVRYFDIQTSGWLRGRRLLLDAAQLAQIEPGGKAIRLLANHESEDPPLLDPAKLREFSDDDLLTVVFAPRAA